MAKQGKSKVVPKLRFPQFRDPWQLKALAPYLEECGSRVPATTSLPIYSSSRSGLTPQASYYDGRTISNEGEYGVVPPNCFVYRHMSDDGQFAFNLNETGSEIAVSKEYPVFRTVNLHAKFLLAKLNHSPAFKAFALSQKAGGTRTRLYFSKLKSWETFLPSLPEQEKIADCLASLDEVIAAQERKVDALKTYMRGLMQQLFPCEGETRPSLRFPEFRDAPDWEPKTLDALVDFHSGSTPSKSNPAYWDGPIPWVSAKDMKQLFLADAEDHISMLAVNDGARVVPAGALLMLTRGMTLLKDVPICVLRREMSFNQDVKALVPKGDTEGLFVALQLIGNKRRLLRMVDIAGHGTGKLATDELKAIELSVPEPAEQQRIADCLFFLEAQTSAESKKLDALKTHKRGLIQHLFPSVEET